MQLDVTFHDVNYSNLMSLHVVSESRVDSYIDDPDLK